MQTLFDLELVPLRRCKSCSHCYEHQYNNTKYCDAQKQKGTAYGDKKIKARDIACPMFQQKTKI